MRANKNISNGSGRRVLRIRWRNSAWLPRVLVRSGRTLPPCLGHRAQPTRKARQLIRLAGVSRKATRFGKAFRPLSFNQINRWRPLPPARALSHARHVPVREIRPRT